MHVVFTCFMNEHEQHTSTITSKILQMNELFFFLIRSKRIQIFFYTCRIKKQNHKKEIRLYYDECMKNKQKKHEEDYFFFEEILKR